MKIPYKAFNCLNRLLKLQTGLVFKSSRQTLYNYRLGGVPPERFAALLFCLLANDIPAPIITRTLENADCQQVIDQTLDQLLEISF